MPLGTSRGRGGGAMSLRWQRPCLHLAISFLSVVIVSLISPTAAATCAQVDKLSLQLPRPRRPEYAGFVVPTSDTDGAPKFLDECLDVKVQAGGANYDPIQELKDGKADLAIVEGSYVAQKVASGEALTIVAGYYQRNGLVWIGMQKALTLQGLSGKKVGAWCCGYQLPFPALIAKQKQSIPTTTVSQNMFSMQQLLDGDVDIASAMVYDELAMPLQMLDSTSNFLKQQSDFYVLDPENHGLTLVHNVVVMETSKLNQVGMRAKVVRFLKTVTKSWHFCRTNENACASAFSESGMPTPVQLWQMREINRFIFPALPGYGLGVLSLKRWDALNQWLVTSGALASAVSSSVVDNSLALDAGALGNASQWVPLPTGGNRSDFCADYGSTVPRICKGNEHKLCPAGEEPSSSTDQANCTKCTPGRYAPKKRRMNTCLVCASGRYSKTAGQSECESCQTGRFWSSTPTTSIPKNKTDCTSCPVGLFADEAGATACQSCDKGSSAGKEGASKCDRCPFGTYSNASGLSECKKCKEGMDTLKLGAISTNECVCPKATYLSKDGTDCLKCPEGMQCNTNSLESALLKIANHSLDVKSAGEFPRVRPGYYSQRKQPLKAYLCKEDATCPGNTPENCAFENEGIACGRCKAGYYREGQKCLKCATIDEGAFNYPGIPLIVGPFVVFFLYCFMRSAREDWGSWWNEICNCAYVFVVQYQILGLLFFTFVQYPDVLRDIMQPWSYLVDIASSLRLSCSEYADFRHLLIMKITAPGLVIAIFVITWAICWVFGKCCGCSQDKKSSSPDKRGSWLKGLLPLKVGPLVNIYFSIFNLLYFPICFMSLQIFMCYEHPHPTTEWSLLFAPEVFCYDSDDWKGMITESVFGVLIYIVAPIAGFAYVVGMAPMHFHEVAFHERWKFLFLKFRPDCFWWGILHMLRTLLLCLTLVFSQTGSRQMYYIFVMLLIYEAGLVIWWPWRHRSSNLFDLFVSSFLLFFIALSSSFSRRTGWLDDQIAEFAVAMTFSPFVVVVLLVGYVGWGRISAGVLKKRKAKSQELAADCHRVFEKFVGLQKDEAAGAEQQPSGQQPICAEAFVQGLSSQDRDVLRTGCSVIVAELLGHQPGYTGLPWRLVHQEQKGGARTWAPATAPHPLKEWSQSLQSFWPSTINEELQNEN